MVPNRLFIIGLACFLLAGCGAVNDDSSLQHSSSPLDAERLKLLIADQQEMQKTAELSLKGEYVAKNTVAVAIRLHNPEEKQIDSVRSWLTFDPSKMKVSRIDDSHSDFDIFLAEENTFDNEKGIVSIGRSSQKPMLAKEAQVATVVFTMLPVRKETVAPIDFYGYSADSAGYTGIMHIVRGVPRNIMKEPAGKTLFLTLLPPQGVE